jgi:arginyl-tRNA synthetase
MSIPRKRRFTARAEIEAAIDTLRSMGLIYEGVLEPPKGKTPEDWEPRVQTLFRSTAHGDDVDRPVQKSDGSWTYFAPDIAYHYNKVRRGFDELIDIFGADHGGYVKRMKAAVSALSNGARAAGHQADPAGEAVQERRALQDVQAGRDLCHPARRGRTGGADVTRFVMLTRKNDAALDFDFDKVLEQSKDNPVFYVQYANARVNSVLRKAREAGLDVSDATLMAADLSI